MELTIIMTVVGLILFLLYRNMKSEKEILELKSHILHILKDINHLKSTEVWNMDQNLKVEIINEDELMDMGDYLR